MPDTDVFRLRKSNLNAFLFADVGAESNGMPLSVVSMLGRLGGDPWATAGRLAGQPRDAAVLELAKGLLDIALWSSVPFGLATVFSGAMRAAGVALTPMLLSIFAIVAIELPATIVLSRIIGLQGVWAAYPIVFCAMLVLQMGYYLLVWRKRAIRRPV